MATKTKAQKQEQAEAIERLREWLPPGSTLYTVISHVSKSGMSRSIKCIALITSADGCEQEIDDISGWVGRALGWPRDHKNGGVKVGGCGMDMGFHLVHTLSYVLHGREDMQHWADTGDAPTDEKRHRPGYTLTHRWL